LRRYQIAIDWTAISLFSRIPETVESFGAVEENIVANLHLMSPKDRSDVLLRRVGDVLRRHLAWEDEPLPEFSRLVVEVMLAMIANTKATQASP